MYYSCNKPLVLFFPFLSILFTLSLSRPCTDKFLSLVQARNFSKCEKLITLSAELAWSNPSPSGNNRHVIHILVGAALDQEEGWLAFGVNPGILPEMVGTRAAIGIKDASNASLYCKTYNITYETRIGCQLRPSELEEVKCTGFEYDKSTQYHMVSATLNLSSITYNISRLNMVWQIGETVEGDEPKKHSATLRNVDSVVTLDLVSGRTSGIAHLRMHLRKVHGVMNIIGWGTLLPVGVIIARFFRKFPFEWRGWWFHLHVGCQILGFLIGAIGWGIGLWLGHASTRYAFHTHRICAIFIFAFTTLQMLALRLRPTPEDDFRKVWDIYHHFLGYALLAVIFANIFEGIRILKPEKENWKWAFIGVLVALGTITLMLEIHTWRKFIALRSQLKKESPAIPTIRPEEEEQFETPLY